MPKKIIKSAKKYTRSADNNEVIKSKYQKKLDSLVKARDVQKTNREIAKEEKLRKKTDEEELELEKAKYKKRGMISKQIFGKKNVLKKLNEKLSDYTDFVQVLPSKFKNGKINDFRIIFTPSKFSKYKENFTKANIKAFGNTINKFLKDNGISKGDINLNLNYEGVVRSSSFDVGDGVKFYNYTEISPTDNDLKEAEYFKKINKFDSVNFIISARK